MNVYDLKKLTISNLNLLLLNKDLDYDLKIKIREELSKRLIRLKIFSNDILEYDAEIISKRGIDINNYLFKDYPTLQDLMELYFTNYYASVTDITLFSEKHLCNEMNFASDFFNKICINEIKNINDRINNNEYDRDTLILFRNALMKRKKNNEYNKCCFYNGIQKYYYNEALQQLSGYPLSNELSLYLFELDVILKDSFRLYKQKRYLLWQSNNKFRVDYTTDKFQKVYENIKDLVY